MNAVEILEGILPGWDDASGCQEKWMQYGGVCEHDDDCFCEHRQSHLVKLFREKLEKEKPDELLRRD